MKNGLYRYEDKDSYTNRGEYIIKLKEMEKSYTFELIKNDMRFSPAHLDMLFGKSKKVKINKEETHHAINISGDDWFCIYPYRAGIPYVFEYTEELEKDEERRCGEMKQGRLSIC